MVHGFTLMPLPLIKLDIFIFDLQVFYAYYIYIISEYYEAVTPHQFDLVAIHLFRSFVSIVEIEGADDEYLFLFYHNFGSSLQY